MYTLRMRHNSSLRPNFPFKLLFILSYTYMYLGVQVIFNQLIKVSFFEQPFHRSRLKDMAKNKKSD